MITSYKYEDKVKENLKDKCLNDLNLTEDEVIIKEIEPDKGLFKNKKYQLIAYKKSDIINSIKEFINTLKEKFNIEINEEIMVRDNNFNVMLVSNNNPILIGKEGKTIEAIQVILNQYIKKQLEVDIKIYVDASNYKGKKLKNFEYEIKSIAKSVLKTHVDVKLDPMNSYNRRIVHNIVSIFPNLTSLSEGEEPNRFVTISYKED